MKVLVACEESQTVTKELRALGHEAYSCDIVDTRGDRPDWHFKCDALELLDEKHGWDMLVAFPPCTHLTVAGARHFPRKRESGEQEEGVRFFLAMINAPIPRIAVENVSLTLEPTAPRPTGQLRLARAQPVGIMSHRYREPDQIIQPYQFGDRFRKRTCLWLKNLPRLIGTHLVDEGEIVRWVGKDGKKRSMPRWLNCSSKNRSRTRSVTFPGIARAMAKQWGGTTHPVYKQKTIDNFFMRRN